MLTNYSCRMSKRTQTGLENLVEFNEIIRYEENDRGFFCQIPTNMGHTCSKAMKKGWVSRSWPRRNAFAQALFISMKKFCAIPHYPEWGSCGIVLGFPHNLKGSFHNVWSPRCLVNEGGGCAQFPRIRNPLRWHQSWRPNSAVGYWRDKNYGIIS